MHSDLRLRFALIMHPMYAIIEHDTVCGERTPPWGSATIEDYVERIRRNLDVLESEPALALGFEFSGMELEALAERDPATVERMRRLAAAGRASFVNGTYSQPHLQILGSESVWRQLEEGLEATERLVGCRVDTYALDEPGIVEQLPQVLRHLGYRFAHLPSGDTCALTFLDPHELVCATWPKKVDFVWGDEFTEWQGLDGSRIPLYLGLSVNIGNRLEGEMHLDPGREHLYIAKDVFPGAPAVLWEDLQRGLYRRGAISMAVGDMGALDRQEVERILRSVDFVLLDRALADRIREAPPRSRARMYLYWSYAEGTEVERLPRANRRAEMLARRAGALNALASALGREPAADMRPAWRRILWCQHHDAYWAGAPEFRATCVGRLEAVSADLAASAEGSARAVADAVRRRGGEAWMLGVFNTTGHPRTDVAAADLVFAPGEAFGLEVEGAAWQLDGETRHPDGSLSGCRLRVACTVPGFGYVALPVGRAAPQPPARWEAVRGVRIERDGWHAEVGADGLFAGIEMPAGALVGNGGGLLRYRDEEGRWHASGRAAPQRRRRGPAADLLQVEGTVGAIPFVMVIAFPHGAGRIELTTRISFDRQTIGTYWEDEAKLCLRWPLAFEGAVSHDVPFGSVAAREHRPLLPATWLDVSREERGIAFFHRGTIKHFVKDGAVANVWAWGGNGNRIGNRNLAACFMKEFDLRPSGTHEVEYALFPHAGPGGLAAVAAAARSWREPLVAVLSRSGGGALPRTLDALSLQRREIEVTDVRRDGDGFLLRVHEAVGGSPDARLARGSRWRRAALRGLDGTPIARLGPYQVGTLSVTGPRGGAA